MKTTTHTTHLQRGSLPVFYQPATFYSYGFFYALFVCPRRGAMRIKGLTPRDAAARLLDHVSTNRFLRSRYEELPLSVGDQISRDDLPTDCATAFQVMIPV